MMESMQKFAVWFRHTKDRFLGKDDKEKVLIDPSHCPCLTPNKVPNFFIPNRENTSIGHSSLTPEGELRQHYALPFNSHLVRGKQSEQLALKKQMEFQYQSCLTSNQMNKSSTHDSIYYVSNEPNAYIEYSDIRPTLPHVEAIPSMYSDASPIVKSGSFFKKKNIVHEESLGYSQVSDYCSESLADRDEPLSLDAVYLSCNSNTKKNCVIDNKIIFEKASILDNSDSLLKRSSSVPNGSAHRPDNDLLASGNRSCRVKNPARVHVKKKCSLRRMLLSTPALRDNIHGQRAPRKRNKTRSDPGHTLHGSSLTSGVSVNSMDGLSISNDRKDDASLTSGDSVFKKDDSSLTSGDSYLTSRDSVFNSNNSSLTSWDSASNIDDSCLTRTDSVFNRDDSSLTSSDTSKGLMSSVLSLFVPEDSVFFEPKLDLGGLNFEFVYMRNIQSLSVKILKGRNIGGKQMTIRMAVSVRLYLMPGKVQIQSTDKHSTQNPNFREEFHFKNIRLTDVKTMTLRMKVYNNYCIGTNGYIGDINLDLGNYNLLKNTRLWCPIQGNGLT